MSFPFINTTVDKRRSDGKTRKKIRSQVMKDYRRRRGAGTSIERSGTPAETIPQRESSEMHQDTSNVPALSRSPAKRVSPGSVTTEIRSAPLFEAFGERPAKRGRPNRSQQEQAASLFLQTAHGLFSNFTISINSRSPVAEEKTVAHNNADVARMLAICKKFNEWMLPDRTRITDLITPRQSYDTTADMMQLFALSLMSIGHLSAIVVFEGDEERAYYKARLLELANRSLQDPARACEDATLSALACLASYEISFNSHEALTHLSGLSRILEWRGGIDKLDSSSGLVVLLEVLDLLHAVNFRVEPVYVGDDDEDEEEVTSDEGIGYLAEATRGWQDLLREGASLLLDQDSEKTSRACFLAWRILLFQPQDNISSWSTQSLSEMDELYQVLQATTNDDSWDANSALQARVHSLLTALATDTNKAHKCWYYSHLSRLMFHTEAQHWTDLKSLVTSFITSQASYRRPQMQTVRAMVNGVEIVIESSLAAQWDLKTV